MPAPTTEARARTRRRLLDAAYELIVEQGMHSLSLDRIASRAGLTRGAVYSNFANKDDLFAALVVEVRGAMRPFDPEQPLTEQLHDGGRRAAATIDAEWPARSMLQLEGALFIARHPELRDKWQQWEADDVGILAEGLAACAREHGEPLTADPRVVVQLLLAVGFGLQQLKLLDPDVDLDTLLPLAYRLLAVGEPTARPAADRTSRNRSTGR